jgi:hypothetical protein
MGSAAAGIFTRTLADALEADRALIDSVIGATMRQRCDEARLDHPLWKLQDAIRGKKRLFRVESKRAYLASFRPHIQVQTERTVPSPIFVAALLTVTRLRVIRLPDTALTANDEARDRIVKSIIFGHWRENDGFAAVSWSRRRGKMLATWSWAERKR